MLSESEMLARATRYAQSALGGAWRPQKRFPVSDPQGLFCWLGTGADDSEQMHGVFVFGNTGEALPCDEFVQEAVAGLTPADRDAFCNSDHPQHGRAYAAFVQEYLRALGRLPPRPAPRTTPSMATLRRLAETYEASFITLICERYGCGAEVAREVRERYRSWEFDKTELSRMRGDGTIVLSDTDLEQLDLFAREFGMTPQT